MPARSTARPESSDPSASAPRSRLPGAESELPRDQLGTAESGGARGLVGKRRVQRLRRVRQRVHRGGAELLAPARSSSRPRTRSPAAAGRRSPPSIRGAAGGSRSSARQTGWSGSQPPRRPAPPRSPSPRRSPARPRARPGDRRQRRRRSLRPRRGPGPAGTRWTRTAASLSPAPARAPARCESSSNSSHPALASVLTGSVIGPAYSARSRRSSESSSHFPSPGGLRSPTRKSPEWDSNPQPRALQELCSTN